MGVRRGAACLGGLAHPRPARRRAPLRHPLGRRPRGAGRQSPARTRGPRPASARHERCRHQRHRIGAAGELARVDGNDRAGRASLGTSVVDEVRPGERRYRRPCRPGRGRHRARGRSRCRPEPQRLDRPPPERTRAVVRGPHQRRRQPLHAGRAAARDAGSHPGGRAVRPRRAVGKGEGPAVARVHRGHTSARRASRTHGGGRGHDPDRRHARPRFRPGRSVGSARRLQRQPPHARGAGILRRTSPVRRRASAPR